eukprot:TRINITY_DN151_c1_g1_i1.p1 TRINITY_DN151_c1_g1~~TRINITY_DN151_c1_g1_i1.p1  ORF type:complete len:291 (+),score=107.16 TRINITY_DN151_c1_g1_i1:987-1859(+)
MLTKFPNVTIHTQLRDGHLYIFANHVLDVLEEHRNLSSLRYDLLPYLIQRQYRTPRPQSSNTLSTSNSGIASTNDDLDDDDTLMDDQDGDQTSSEVGSSDGETSKTINLQHMNKFISSQMDTFAMTSSSFDSKDLIRVMTYVERQGYCKTADTKQAFQQLNFNVANNHVDGYIPSENLNKDGAYVHHTCKLGQRTKIGPGCVVGKGFVAGESDAVKKSIIGHHCTIGNSVKIENSILMDYVTVDDNAKIVNTIVCSNAHIKEKTVLNGCTIGEQYTVNSMANLENETLVT